MKAKAGWLWALMLVLGAGCDSGGPGGVSGYPRKSITLICPWAPGGGTDRVSRFMAEALQKELGKPVVVVNRTGGSGATGHAAGAHAAPDGYTITMGTFELSTMHWMGISELTWQNFEPLMQVNADAAAILVRSNAPWANLQDFVEHLKRHPGQVKMSGTATGGAWDLARAGFLRAAGLPVNAILWVPAQGAAPSLVELLGGHIEAVCCAVPEALAQIEAGQLRALAVMSPSRLPDHPAIPTVREHGIAWEAVGWRGLLLPRGTAPEIVSLLHQRCEQIAASPSFQQFMKKNGFGPAVKGPEAFREFLRQQDDQWKGVVEAAGYAKR